MISNNVGPVNEFSPSLRQQLSKLIQDAAHGNSGPKIAAFDADGTLWDTDAGEAFFDYQIHRCGLDLPADPWSHYHELKKRDPTAAYVWLAQINKGRELSQVRAWARTCVEANDPFPVFESQRWLIAELKRNGFDVFIVTASVKWAVEPAAALVGVDFDHVLGITTEVVDGIVTEKPVLPITWRQGKADALLARTGGIRPLLCSGNTFGDSALLGTAEKFQLAITSTAIVGSGLYEEERRLRVEARARGWHMHFFRAIEGE